MDKVAVLLSVLSTVVLPACSEETIEPRLQYYVEAQEALAADDFTQAQQAMRQLGQYVEGELTEAVTATAGAGDIKAMRLAFRPMSDKLVKVLAVPESYALTYCPMVEGDKNGYWIQKKGEIMNPYLGASMLHCGAFEE